MRNAEQRILWWMMAAIVILAVLCLGTGCATVRGVGKDLTAFAEGGARALEER